MDLLPSYIDGLTSSTTNEAVKTHIETCASCRHTLELMRAPEDTPSVSAPSVSDAYKSKHPYIGDVSTNGRTAGALGIAEHIGTFTNKLQTITELYGWKLILSQDIPQNRQASVEESMRSYDCVLLALIDNLGEVTYDYTLDGTPASLTVTCEDAIALIGGNIKDAAQTPDALQELMQQTGTL